MNFFKILILSLFSSLLFFSCKDENEQQLLVEKMEKKNRESFEQINKAWLLNIPNASIVRIHRPISSQKRNKNDVQPVPKSN